MKNYGSPDGIPIEEAMQATRALERLQACVEEALELSLRVARQYGDTAEEYRVQESLCWLDTEGKKIISSIRRKIAFADANTRLAMADSLTAAIESGQAAMERILDDSENRYLLWQWADRILSSVQWAFESLPEGRMARKAVRAMSDRCPKCGVEQPKPIAIEGPWLYYGESFHEIDGNDCIRRQLEQAKAEIERLRREREVLAAAVMGWQRYLERDLGTGRVHVTTLEAHERAISLIDGEKGGQFRDRSH